MPQATASQPAMELQHMSRRQPLGTIQRTHFQAGRQLNGTFSYECKNRHINNKMDASIWRRALVAMMQHNPMLNRKIVGSGEDACFEPYKYSNKELDSILHVVLPQQGEDLQALVRRKLDSLLQAYGPDGCDDEAVRRPLQVVVAWHHHPAKSRRRTKVCLGSIISHAFGDGIALGTCGVLLAVYVQTPPWMWWMLRRMCSKDHNVSALEMALKGDYERIMIQCNHNISRLPKRKSLAQDPNIFCLPNRPASNASTPWSFSTCLETQQQVETFQRQLRKHDLSVTSFCVALSVKIAATLLHAEGLLSLDGGYKYILSNTPYELRGMGTWNRKQRRRKWHYQFPVIGDYAFPLLTRLPIEKVLKEPVESIAAIVKQDIRRLQTDPEYRMENVLMEDRPITRLLVGASSVQVPTKHLQKLGIRQVELSAQVDISKFWHVWCYVLSGSSDRISLSCHVHLPLADSSASAQNLQSVVQGILQDQCTCLDVPVDFLGDFAKEQSRE